MEREKDSIFKLPSRPNRSYKPSGRPISLVTNHFEVKLNNIHTIYQYHMDITPQIEFDNRKLKDQIVDNVRKEAQNFIGLFILSGFTVFSSQKPQGFDKYTEIKSQVEEKEYICKFTMVRTHRVENIFSNIPKQKDTGLKFFNVMAKFFLKELKFSEFGKISKYYDMSRCKEVPGTDMNIYGGFETSFNVYESGLFLRMEICHKVVRKDSVLNMINKIYRTNRDKSKNENRQIVKDVLVGKIILANYGNFKYWRVSDILFDRDCTSFEMEGSDLNLYDYYKQRYNLTITTQRQPLLMVEIKKVENEKMYGYLIPEFCMLTGIGKGFNEFQRRRLVEICKKTPNERIKKIESLARKINSESESGFNGKQLQKQIGISIEDRVHELKGFQLEPPVLKMGRDEEIDSCRGGNFQFRNPFYDSPNHSLKWVLIHFKQFDYSQFLRTMFQFSKQFQFEMSEPKRFDMGHYNKRILEEIEILLEDRVAGHYDIAVLVLPNNMRYAYARIKKVCTIRKNLVSQVIFESTLQRKFTSVCSNLLQQMAVKCGSILWVPKPKCGFPPKTMIIGVNTCKDRVKKKTLVSFVSTRNDKFYKYFSRVQYQREADIITHVQSLIKESITAYYKTTGNVPQNIIYLREGLQSSLIDQFQEMELKELLKGMKQISQDYEPNLIAILVDKRIGQKFYQISDHEKGLLNPPSGTIVHKEICSRNYDFYLMAQNVNSGTCTPTHYNVVYDSSDFSEGQLQELLFSQCFNYMNWNGAVRVPAPLQYATKLSQFITQSVNEETHMDLRKNLYFL